MRIQKRRRANRQRVYLRLWRRRLRPYVDLRGWYQRIIHLDAPPKKIAISFAIGVYIAFIPLLGVQTALSIALSWLLRLNVVAVVSGSLFTNPVTFVPLLWISFHAGMLVYPYGENQEFEWTSLGMDNVLEVMKPYLIQLLIGLGVVGLCCAAASYFLTLFLIKRYREHHEGK
ncbi:DUF2062 domain-containing protein [Desulfurispirillum indicum]|uniref:DUF2062 domain-containing protein n=1 Tax=Desulfurispirillum indicum TaxID=936456 RepID=UPI001CFA3B74|nr:DUF2062 domain-containing protein [Desulfurispirillum indicum]UCZ56464.1 DUF2062 domain-containing protein [Desulfurispirillum indicum]